MPEKPRNTNSSISTTAILNGSVILGSNVTIMDHAIIHDNVIIEDNTFIGSYSIIGERHHTYYDNPKNYSNPKTIIGENSLIRSHSVIYAGCSLGENFKSGHSIIIRENSNFGISCMFGNLCQTDEGVKIGNYVRCHSRVFLTGNMKIGEYSCLYPGVITTDVRYPPYGENRTPPRIGSKCIIGAGTLLMAGVSLGDGAFIGAGSLVASDIPDKVLAKGRPAKKIKLVSEIQIPDFEMQNPFPIDEAMIKNWPRQ